MSLVDERPANPIKDILIFEKQLNKKYAHETKRRFVYFVLLMIILSGYILHVTREVYNVLWDIDCSDPAEMTVLLCRIYLRMLGAVLLLGYVFIRMLRKSSKITNSLTAQLKLLNIFFKNQKLNLCSIKTPNNIKVAINVFREEEQRKKTHWLKRK
ncbi:hypothetical protein NEMIN01_2183 [Nematocida minor]|uniref:uncharacterized protein n=1 Tax=Nematocida minor TaxID=1912983 RepID=UPI00221FB50D|nr:uncharacterized protein NEMIN01_2183 [Nematocida minor]KAI5192738.1 hypothetical protein NEMIN01_2183 [Nematocida minor]